MTDDRYLSPLSQRYASEEMQRLWGARHRVGLWRRLWLALAESQRDLGLAIPELALAEMRAHLDDADLAAAADYERRFRHDVMAHVHAFGDQAPGVLAEQLIHFCDWINHPKAELVKSNLGGICALTFQVMGQHQEDNWFRSDIFSLVDWIDHLFDVGAYETEEI